MVEYTRTLELTSHGRKIIVEFDDTSTIYFYYEDDSEEAISFDPSFLKTLYNAYSGMEWEIVEDMFPARGRVEKFIQSLPTEYVVEHSKGGGGTLMNLQKTVMGVFKGNLCKDHTITRLPEEKPMQKKLADFMTVSAARYALGRRTYIVSETCKYLKEGWGNLADNTRALIKRDVRDAIEKGDAGMNFDVAEWKEILEL